MAHLAAPVFLSRAWMAPSTVAKSTKSAASQSSKERALSSDDSPAALLDPSKRRSQPRGFRNQILEEALTSGRTWCSNGFIKCRSQGCDRARSIGIHRYLLQVFVICGVEQLCIEPFLCIANWRCRVGDGSMFSRGVLVILRLLLQRSQRKGKEKKICSDGGEG